MHPRSAFLRTDNFANPRILFLENHIALRRHLIH
jgi:hypothetical protein